ncbi:MAG: hypothetical protein LBB12_02480 [Holosporaceae bacterium]|jgi:hypothetical protein|nr:hypothetical protein [Holosporaceae bacterium]
MCYDGVSGYHLRDAFAKTINAQEMANMASSALDAFYENFQKVHSPGFALELLNVDDVNAIGSVWNVGDPLILHEEEFIEKINAVYAFMTNLRENLKNTHIWAAESNTTAMESAKIFEQSAKLVDKKLRTLELLRDCTDLYLLWRLFTANFLDVDVHGTYAGKILKLYSHCCVTAIKHHLAKDTGVKKSIAALRDFLSDAALYMLPETALAASVEFAQKYSTYANVIAELKKTKRYYQKRCV